jgi:hypothetical protein
MAARPAPRQWHHPQGKYQDTASPAVLLAGHAPHWHLSGVQPFTVKHIQACCRRMRHAYLDIFSGVGRVERADAGHGSDALSVQRAARRAAIVCHTRCAAPVAAALLLHCAGMQAAPATRLVTGYKHDHGIRRLVVVDQQLSRGHTTPHLYEEGYLIVQPQAPVSGGGWGLRLGGSTPPAPEQITWTLPLTVHPPGASA